MEKTPDSITTMLSTLKWPVLYERRRWARLTLLYKLLHNLLQIPECYTIVVHIKNKVSS